MCFLLFRLANESAVKDIQQKLRDVQKDNGEIISRLTVKERECDVKTEEKVRFHRHAVS